MRDSAGARIVENTTPAWQGESGWHLSAAPSVDIGVVEGDPHYQLDGVQRTVRLSDGRIVVANGGSQELRFYDAAGKFITSSGRKGGGPGEFQSLSWVGVLPGDSLLVYDAGAPRLSVLDSAGRFVRAGTPPLGEGMRLSRMVGRFGDGSLVMATSNMLGSGGALPNGLIRPPITYARVGPDGALLDTIGTFPGAAAYVRSSGSRSSGFSISFQRGGLYHAPVSDVHGESFYYGSSDAYEIGIYGADGTLHRSIRRAQPNRKVTKEVIDQLVQAALDQERERRGTVTPEARSTIEKRYAEQPLPETMPAYRSLLVDAAGNLWVAEFDLIPDKQPSRWTVFEPDGQMLGTVTMPTRFTPYEIGADYVLGRWRDDLDVEHVRLYGLEKGNASSTVASGS